MFKEEHHVTTRPTAAASSAGAHVDETADEYGWPTNDLKRRLTPGQLTMMSLGGAIGAGLFVGSGAAVSIAGPAVLVAYAIAGAIIICIMYMLGEMAVREPTSGAFSVFAERAMGRVAGSTVGWLYWVQMIIVVAAEAMGAAGVMNGWFPALGVGGWIIVFMAVFTALNLMDVKHYGRAEFWFAMLKVIAIIAFLVLGAALLLGLIPNVPSPGFSNLLPAEGFAPTGIVGIASALLIVMFAFGGTEIAAIAAAETSEPSTSITKAVRSVVFRILVFYIGSIFVIVSAMHWNDPKVHEGPFAAVLELTHIPFVDTIIKIIVVVALLSALNANLYAGSRMIFSLSTRGNAPVFLSRVSPAGVPRIAVIASVIFGFATGVVAMFNPDDNLLVPLLNAIGSTLIVLWICIAISFLILRRRSDREGERLEFRVPGGQAVAIFALVGLVAIVVIAMGDPDARVQLLQTIGLAIILAVISWIVFSAKRGSAGSAAREAAAAPRPREVRAEDAARAEHEALLDRRAD
ncbi:GABA permease [Pseudoclavibacter triregionum]|nr:GABA permease [Pseudoclavibacter triregionum]